MLLMHDVGPQVCGHLKTASTRYVTVNGAAQASVGNVPVPQGFTLIQPQEHHLQLILSDQAWMTD